MGSIGRSVAVVRTLWPSITIVAGVAAVAGPTRGQPFVERPAASCRESEQLRRNVELVALRIVEPQQPDDEVRGVEQPCLVFRRSSPMYDLCLRLFALAWSDARSA